jgi:CTP:molybdopterin cytidylyltransferase MocA
MKTTGLMKAAGLITVAGQSQRMHAFKPLLPINGTPMIAVTANVFGDAGITDLFVVVGKRGEEIVSALDGYNARFLWNDAFAQTEMFDSLQIGLTATQPQAATTARLFLPGDMPAVDPWCFASLWQKLESEDYDVVSPAQARADCIHR